MTTPIQIRPAQASDATAISHVIVDALRTTNRQSYSEAVIARVVDNFSPAAVTEVLAMRQVLVAVSDEHIVGTASLDSSVVRSVFVASDHQGRGVGRALMARVEAEARAAQVNVLKVPSSTTAEAFYARLGYTAVGERFHGEERTIIMERTLS